MTLDKQVLVIDNGSYDIKIGYASAEVPEPLRIPNCLARSKDRKTFVGDELYNCRDFAGLVFRRPHEKDQLVSWETQKAIWDSIFWGKNRPLGTVVDPSENSLILTESPLTLPSLSSNMDQIVFEEYGFDSYYRCVAGSLVPWNDISNLFSKASNKPIQNKSPVAECCLVIDSGFSATHIVPVVLGEVYWPAVKRINVAGKQITNYLKETVSFRHYNMMDETYLMNVIKEKTCFISNSFSADLEECYINKKKTRMLVDYVLPDYKTGSRVGFVYDPSDRTTSREELLKNHQVLTLGNERFICPELLFNPSDVGLDQCGIPEAVQQCVNLMPEEVRSMLLANIVLTGGTSNFSGYRNRLFTELQPYAPQGDVVRVSLPDDPATYAWEGGCKLGSQKEMLTKAYVTKEDYLEQGTNLTMAKFGMKKMDTVVELNQ
jgi:actin-related protein 6